MIEIDPLRVELSNRQKDLCFRSGLEDVLNWSKKKATPTSTCFYHRFQSKKIYHNGHFLGML